MDFLETIKPYIHTYTIVRIDQDYYQRICSHARSIANAKKSEMHHLIDNRNEEKRFVTGLLGEAALEKILNMKIIDWTIGKSQQYFHSDIPGYNVGIKTVEFGKFPIIFKKNHEAEVICIRSIKEPNTIAVCGLATIEVLNKYQDESLIIDPRLRQRNTKTGFYGFGFLLPVINSNSLNKYKK